MLKIGFHTSIAGGLVKALDRAKALGCGTIQIFSHNPRGWSLKERALEEAAAFRKLREEYAISPVFIHASYLINLASADPGLREKSVGMVVHEMDIADSIGADHVIIHTGSASGDNPKKARRRATDCLIEVSKRGRWRAGLLLENTAGERGDITSKIGELSEIFENLAGTLVAGICLDTCHAFSAGYDIGVPDGLRIVEDEIRKYIGKENIRLVHLNDSKTALGSGRDRHEHIGQGKIGQKGLKNFLKHPLLIDVPLILETPKKTESDDRENFRVVLDMLKVRPI